jgi:putative phosphoesterase
MTRLAVLSDIHGNILALEAVVADMATRAVDHVVNLGDHASGPLWPRETLDFLVRCPWTQIAGNHDRQLVAEDPSTHGASDRYAYDQLTPQHALWLTELPATTMTPENVLLCHGTPTSDLAYLVETIVDRRLRLATPTEVAERLGQTTARVVLCGHSHSPRLVVAEHGTIVVNPGSVGLPAFDDTGPDPHISETGSPHARYAILDIDGDACEVSFHAVSYDHVAASDQAKHAGRDDWAMALRTGYTLSSR